MPPTLRSILGEHGFRSLLPVIRIVQDASVPVHGGHLLEADQSRRRP